MAWNSITISLKNTSDAEAFEAYLLSLGAVAVTYTDGGDEPILEPELNTTPLWSQTNLTALFEIDTDLFEIKTSLKNEFGEEYFDILEHGRVEDKVWEREWLSHFKPMRFGERLWICPTEHEIPADEKTDDAIIIDMDPGVAFGTGTHETTSMCLRWLDSAKLKRKTVLDFGCGSGILAIAALKLGAKHATCIDIDIQAVEATLQNASRNQVDKKLKAHLPDDSDWDQDEKYDILLANILAAPLIALAQDIRRRVKRGGQIVLSGILAEQEDTVRAAYSKYFTFSDTVHDGDWIRLDAKLKTPSEQLGDEEQITYCPTCDETFYINAEDLDRADGEVRCGECNTIFYAIDFLRPEDDENISNLNNPIDSGIIPKAHMVTGLWMHGKNGLEQVDLAQASTAPEDSNPKTETETQTESIVIPSPQALNIPDDASYDVSDHDSEGVPEDAATMPSIDPAAIHLHALEDDTPLNLDELDALTRPKRSKTNVLWLVFALLTVASLGLQYVHQHRAQLAMHPGFGQNLQNIYTKLPFDLEPDWQLDAYVVNASGVVLNPRNPDELIASFNLTNTANHAQIFPLIRLSLFNRWNERIAYRDLSAEDYLPDNPKKYLEARGRAEFKVALQDPGAEALDYNVEVCLLKNGVIRCQDKVY